MRFFFIISLLFLLISSCSKENRWDCFKRTGSTITEERTLADFTEISIDNKFNITLVQDSVNKIIFEGGENMLPLVTADISDNKLSLNNNNRCNWTRSYDNEIKATIHTRNLQKIYVNEMCDISSQNTIFANILTCEIRQNVVANLNMILHCNSFEFKQHSGTGTYNFKGIANNVYFYIKGTGYIYANNLHSSISDIVNMSSGDVHVNVSQKLTVEFTGRGDVYYKGSPSEIIYYQEKNTGNIYQEN